MSLYYRSACQYIKDICHSKQHEYLKHITHKWASSYNTTVQLVSIKQFYVYTSFSSPGKLKS